MRANLLVIPIPVKLLCGAVGEVTKGQPELFDLKVGERAIVAQVGIAFARMAAQTRELRNWKVDLEYDREGWDGDLKRRYDEDSTASESHVKLEGRSFRLGVPDIVLHQRGSKGRDYNMIVVEMKRTHRIFWKSCNDRLKVNEFMSRHGYQYGCLIGFGRQIGDCQPKVSWRKWGDNQWSNLLDLAHVLAAPEADYD